MSDMNWLQRKTLGDARVLHWHSRKARRRDLRQLGIRDKGGREYRVFAGAVVRIEPKANALLLTIRMEDGELSSATARSFDETRLGVERLLLVAIHRGRGITGNTYTHRHLLLSWERDGDPGVTPSLAPLTSGGGRPSRRRRPGEPEADRPCPKRLRFAGLPVAAFLDGLDDS